MVTPDDDRSGIVFDSIVWRGDFMVEISWTEERDRGDGIALVRTLVVDRKKLPDQYRSMVDGIIEFLEEGQVVLRNPPERINRHG